jgi:D-beta-D-heptose 7-phosphate kinase/D-beta-D-heptose 1-phosphate adenosyltransferase
MDRLLAKFPALRLLVVGDLMLDEYILGDAHRLSPEAPVPVVLVERETSTPGGAANVALNLVSLGAKAELCGWSGTDSAATRLRARLDKVGVAYDSRFSRPDSPTIVKTRVVVRHQQLCRLDREAVSSSYALHATPARAWIEEKLPGAHAIIFSDYAKGSLSTDLLRDLIPLAKKHGLLVALDPKPRRLLEARGLDLLTPNRAEALELAGFPHEPRHAPPPWETVCARIHEKFGPRYLVITLGSEGMLLSENGRVLEKIPTYAREVFDVSGAGDTVIAALALALAAGATLPEAAHFANTAAGVVVGKFGTATATPAEILNYHP